MDRRHCLRACAGMVISVACASVTYPAFAISDTSENVSTIRRQLRLIITLANPYEKELSNQILWMYLPATQLATQRLDALNVSTEHRLHTDCLGHSILELKFARFPSLAQKVITLSADVTLLLQPALVSLDNPREWLEHERYIEVKDSGIQTLATHLKQATPLETAKTIYEWIKKNLVYAGYVAEDVGAREALIQRRGDCTEYAYLAVALARANQIPARMVGGYVVNNNAVLRATEYHNWAEIYVDGTWRLLDAQKQNWLTSTEQYVAFRYYRDRAINALKFAHRFNVQGDIQVLSS